MNIATAVPQAVAPLIGAVIVVLFAHLASDNQPVILNGGFAGAEFGFGALFVASAVFAVLGGLSIMPIKSVK